MGKVLYYPIKNTSGGGGTTSPLTTKGDLYTFATDNTRLGVGADGSVLVADSTQATGLKWSENFATKDYVNEKIVSSVQYQGGYDATTNPTLLSALKGYMYTVTVAGNFGGFWNPSLEIGDVIIAEIDTPTVLADWTVVNKNLDANSILTALKTVDGAGSGLDADLLDGYNSSDFVKQFSTSLDAIDLNDIKISGSYRVNINCLNMPQNTYLSLIVVGNMTSVVSQRATHFQTGETWIRSFNTVWSVWRRVYDNVNNVKDKTIILENPLATDDFLLLEPLRAVTITRVTHQIFGATNVSFNITHSGGTDLWASDKVATTTKTSETVFTDATCTANNQIRYQASAITGTPTKIEVTVYYTED